MIINMGAGCGICLRIPGVTQKDAHSGGAGKL
jgi:hypothetical protein